MIVASKIAFVVVLIILLVFAMYGACQQDANLSRRMNVGCASHGGVAEPDHRFTLCRDGTVVAP